jgi:hypothetical protein
LGEGKFKERTGKGRRGKESIEMKGNGMGLSRVLIKNEPRRCPVAFRLRLYFGGEAHETSSVLVVPVKG